MVRKNKSKVSKELVKEVVETAVDSAVKSVESEKEKAPQARMSRSMRRRRRVLRQGVPVPGPDGSTRLMTVPRKQLSFTPSGKAWAQQYLNPCHSDSTGQIAVGVPTGLSTETAIVRSRVDQDITAPPNLVALWSGDATGQTAAQQNDWYLGLIVPPWLDDCVVLIAAAFQPTNFAAIDSLVNNAGEYPTWKQTATPAVLSSTIWYCKISEPVFQQYSTDTTRAALASAFRMVKRGITTELIADDLTNRGYVTAAQWLIEPENFVWTGRSTKFTAATSGGTVDQSTVIVSAVGSAKVFLTGDITPKFITSIDGRTYQGAAKEGCYMPVYVNSEDHKFHPYYWRSIDLAVTSQSVDSALSTWQGRNADGSTNDTGDIQESTSFPQKVVNEDQNIGVIWYQGISGAAGVRVKGRHSIEVITEPQSQWGAFSAAAAPEDRVAITQAHAIQNHLEHAYPACYNDWGFLGNVVKGLVSKIPVVGGLLSNLVEPAGKAIGGLLGI